MVADRTFRYSVFLVATVFAPLLIITSSFVHVRSQTPDSRKGGADKTTKTTPEVRAEKPRDLSFGTSGVDLQFLIRELARDMDLNVTFDSDTFRTPRKTNITLANVTTSAALDYLLLQEGLTYDEVGPKTILISSRDKAASIRRFGVGITPLNEQLARYFGVEGGILINNVRPDSPGSSAGLKAGDVITAVDGVPVRSTLGLIRSIDAKADGDISLKIVRNRKEQTFTVTHPKGIER
ncbi:MAG: PDZ domain-containing protein [Acidobacteriota bacterium]